MINDLQIRTFLEVARCCNFSKTAERLFVTQPTVSKSVAKLERELDVTLLVRLPHKCVALTAEGQIYFELFEKFINNLDAAKFKINDTNKIRFAIADGWSLSEINPNVITKMKSKYPTFDFEIACLDNLAIISGLQSDASYNKVDIAVALEETFRETKGLCSETVTQVNMVIIFSQEFQKINGPIHSPLDAKNALFFIAENDKHLINSSLLKNCAIYGFTPRFQTVCNRETVLAMVESGLGVAFFDTWGQNLDKLGLLCIELEAKHTVTVAWRKNLPDNIARSLIEILREMA